MGEQRGEKRRVELPLEFISLFAHEVRNPLNALSAVGSILAREPKAEMFPWLSSTVARQVDRVAFLVDLLLDGSRLAAGCFKAVEERVSVPRLLDEALEDFGDLLQKAQITVVREEDPGLPDVVADKRRLRGALFAIIENVAAHVPSGGRVRFFIASMNQSVELRIHDTGRGMEPQDIEALQHISADRLFDRAARGRLGLSLVLAKASVESVQGSFFLRHTGDDEWTGAELILSFRHFPLGDGIGGSGVTPREN